MMIIRGGRQNASEKGFYVVNIKNCGNTLPNLVRVLSLTHTRTYTHNTHTRARSPEWEWIVFLHERKNDPLRLWGTTKIIMMCSKFSSWNFWTYDGREQISVWIAAYVDSRRTVGTIGISGSLLATELNVWRQGLWSFGENESFLLKTVTEQCNLAAARPQALFQFS